MTRSEIAAQLLLIEGDKRAGLLTWLTNQGVVEADRIKILTDLESYAEYYP